MSHLDFTPSIPLHYSSTPNTLNLRRTTKPASSLPSQSNSTPTELWGSNHSKGYLTHLPSACIPYIQLTRLYNPAPVMLVYFPHLFGLLYAAIHLSTPFPVLIQSVAVLGRGSFFFSNAAHVWDDVVDAPFHALIERTRNRPIPRGAVTKV
jgi:4-hydroxybenzoate polyprenyltransferase